jgi:hypothetical protein
MLERKSKKQSSAREARPSSDDHLIDESGEESFPASDPPAHSVSQSAQSENNEATQKRAPA